MADAPVPSATRPSRVPSEQDLWTQPEPDDQYADVVSASARTRSLSIGGSSLSVSIHEELDQLDHHSPRARFSRSGSELTFALTLSQSELDVAKSVALAGGPGAKTRRVLKLSVKTKPKTRSMLFCAVLWRLIPACAAAAVVFGAASRWGHSAPSLFGRSGAPASLEGGARAALLSRETARGSIESYSWGVEPEAGPLDAATTVVLQQGSAILSQGSAIFNERIERHHQGVEAAEKKAKQQLGQLRTQLAPLVPHEEERREEIPKFGVALAATLASTAFAALSPEQERLECREGDDHLYRKPAAPVPPHLYRPPDAVDADDHLWTMPVNGGAAVSASVAEWGAAAAQPLVDALPDGFCVQDAIEYADLSGYTYHVDDDGAVDAAAISRDLEAKGMELVDVFSHPEDGMYAYLARKGDSDLYLAFRGTMCLPSVKVDLDYHPASDDEVDVLRQALAVGGDAVALPQGVQLHGGFLKTWLRSREEILDAIDGALRTVDTGATRMKMHVTGHSMGGALGMLASLELAARGAARPELDKFNEHATYTFAAPRVGNCPFAELFERTFPSASAHWALQNAGDAIPHLPFAAWGFRHPGQIAKLPNSEGAPIRVTSEEGDPVHMIRPREGKLINWAVCHELDTYASQLRALAGFGPADDGCADGYDWGEFAA